LDTIVSGAETDEPIEMPLELWTGLWDPENNVLGGGPDPPG